MQERWSMHKLSTQFEPVTPLTNVLRLSNPTLFRELQVADLEWPTILMNFKYWMTYIHVLVSALRGLQWKQITEIHSGREEKREHGNAEFTYSKAAGACDPAVYRGHSFSFYTVINGSTHVYLCTGKFSHQKRKKEISLLKQRCATQTAFRALTYIFTNSGGHTAGKWLPGQSQPKNGKYQFRFSWSSTTYWLH